MNIILISIEGIRPKDISYYARQFKESVANETFVLDATVAQSSRYHNFRLPYACVEMNRYTLYEKFSSEKIFTIKDDNYQKALLKTQKKRNFFIHLDISNQSSLPMDEYIKQSENKVKGLLDFLDENRYINTRSAIILMGLSGRSEGDHPYKIFGKEKNLYDEQLNVPLSLFHPKKKIVDVFNSVSFDMLLHQIELLRKDDKDIDSLLSINNCLKNLVKAAQVRSDIKSRYKNICGYRGPLFQYYCAFNEDGSISGHELYDLNNDFKMQNDLTSNLSNISTQVVDLCNVYRKRLWEEFKDRMF